MRNILPRNHIPQGPAVATQDVHLASDILSEPEVPETFRQTAYADEI
jgi:hypothetical protein